jgi:hypothetical protein
MLPLATLATLLATKNFVKRLTLLRVGAPRTYPDDEAGGGASLSRFPFPDGDGVTVDPAFLVRFPQGL